MWESSIDINAVREIRCKTTLYLGVGAINKADDICAALCKEGISRIIVVASAKAYKVTGAWAVVEAAFRKHNIEYRVYDGVRPNPEDDQVDAAATLAKSFDAQAVFGIGGGSPIDAAKAVAILMAYPDRTCKQLFNYEFTPERAAPLVAINTTHGTGTEVDRFAVVTIPSQEFKPAIAYDCSYPRFAIDDPALMTMLPADQTVFVSLDAINHVTEAATTVVASPYSILTAQETVRLVAKYLPQAIANPKDLTARYWLLYASAIAGISFDNGLLHFTHALEHPLSAVKPELAHGKGLAMLLPAVIEAIYPARAAVLASLFAPIVPGLKGEASEATMVGQAIEAWIAKMGVTGKLSDEGFADKDLDRLCQLTKDTPSLGLLLSLAPVEATPEVVRRIYARSLKPMRAQAAAKA